MSACRARVHGLCVLVWLSAISVSSQAQQLQTFKIQPKPISAVVQPEKLTPGEQRELYRERLARAGTHHFGEPLAISDAPLVAEVENEATVIKPKVRQAEFGQGVRIRTITSVTGTAQLDYNHALPIAEPTVAVRGEEVLVTGNTYAAFSTDGGKTFKALAPHDLFGTPAIGGGFCCDQVAIYDRDTDTMLWLMQGYANDTGNSFRLFVAQGGDIRAQNWQVYDIAVTQAFADGGVWFDFPDMALSDRYLYISTNVFTLKTPDNPNPKWEAAAVMRLPKKTLAAYGEPEINIWTTGDRGSLRFAQGSRERMFWGAHRSTDKLMVQWWDEDRNEPSTAVPISVEPWERPSPSTTASSLAKNGKPWLKRLGKSNNGRVTAGWRADGKLGFAWAAGADNRFPLVHTRVAIIDEARILGWTGPLAIKPTAQPHIWNSITAFAYASASPNDRGDVAISVAFGGPKHFPSHAVGVLTSKSAGDQRGETIWEWGLTVAREGLNTPYCLKTKSPQPSGKVEYQFDRECGNWGDYFAVRPHGSQPHTWVTVAYTIRSTGDNELLKAEAEFVWFENFGSGPLAERSPTAITPATLRSRQ